MTLCEYHIKVWQFTQINDFHVVATGCLAWELSSDSRREVGCNEVDTRHSNVLTIGASSIENFDKPMFHKLLQP